MGTLSQTLTLRAAFVSSTYLLSQIPGPGRSSDDDLLTLPFKGAIRACGLFITARLPSPPTPARHLMMPCQSFGLCFFACLVLKKFTDVEWCAQRVINYVSVF